MKIVVDAMGGDHAPEAVVEGAVAAVREFATEVILVGDTSRIQQLLKKNKYSGGAISVQQASEVVDMHDAAASSIRKKRDSSIVVGLNLVKEGKAEAFFSAGNTGAVACGAVLTLGLLPGIEGPA